jgi:glycosyltransferase involved in cell wall biosynthesis
MKIALLLTTYNRPSYLKRTLDSLAKADLTGVDVLIVDDCSSDPETIRLIDNSGYTYFKRDRNGSIKNSLLNGFDLLFGGRGDYDIVINLDSDALVRNDFIKVLLDLHKRFPHDLITGFNCDTLNANGTVRHKVIEQGEGYNIKGSVGGINMLLTKETYANFVRPALVYSLEKHLNWDHQASLNAGRVVVCQPSAIQHIGYESSMGHSGPGREQPDTSSDFKPIHLPNVTLIGIDNYDPARLQRAADKCTEHIQFGAVKMITDIPIKSKEEYSRFCMKELYKHVDTEFMLVIQYDGYIMNADAWDNSWFEYDYIGAPWEWYAEQQIGNGGFSLRSRKLMEWVANDPFITEMHPEDDKICRKYGYYLKAKGIKFAPIEVARKFSIEGYKSDKTYRGHFGFHGTHVQFAPSTKKLCVLQPHGLGDVIFTQTLIHSLGDYEVTWPVKKHFVEDLNRAYPQFKFIPENESPINLNTKKDSIVNGYRTIPIRWSNELQRVPYAKVMRAKYDMFRKNFQSWKERAIWNRNEAKENELFALLALTKGEYSIKNLTFGCNLQCKIDLSIDAVELRQIEGFSLFDWAKVLEGAKEIHTVSTSVLYLLDLLETGPVHVYVRAPNEKDHSFYDYIFTGSKFIYR